MSWVAAAVAGGTAIVGGIIQGNAARDAADTQANAGRQAMGEQSRQFDQTMAENRRQYDEEVKRQQPWRDTGSKYLGQLDSAMPELNRNFSMSDFNADPGYQFRMDEANKAIERSAAARGGLNSGRTMKELTRYNSDYASGEYQNAYNRFTNDQTNRFNRLSTMSGLGQVANQQMGNAGANYMNNLNSASQNYSNNIGQNITGIGNAQAAGMIGQGNALGGTLGGLANNFVSYSMMNRPNQHQMPVGNSAGQSYVNFSNLA